MTNLEIFFRILNTGLYDLVRETALEPLPRLSERYKRDLWVKREDQQSIFSFKIRGAYNKIKRLDADARARGIVTASAGNHAQGVAYSANKLGIKAHIIMPQTTPETKVRSVRSWGGKPTLIGDSFDEAFAYSQQLVAEHGYSYIPPFNDFDVIAGQGTIAMEILNQHNRPIEAIFVPVGGGGIVAGIGAYVKNLRPEIKIIGVEPEDAASMQAALAAKQPVALDEVGLFADGVAVKIVGDKSFQVASQCIDDIVTASVDEICAAVKDTFDDTRILAEPAGALALAGMKKYLESGRSDGNGGSLITINSGANTDFDRLRYICERSEIGEKREALFSVKIPERPGSFKKFCRTIGKRPVSEFNYRYADPEQAYIFVGIKIKTVSDREKILANLHKNQLQAEDISDSELAKAHLRHMIGGKAGAQDEVLYSFSFPERPGALLNFLEQLSDRWNISLFHYRNHGAAWNSALVGLQVPPPERAELQQALVQLNYPFVEESSNNSYTNFLK